MTNVISMCNTYREGLVTISGDEQARSKAHCEPAVLQLSASHCDANSLRRSDSYDKISAIIQSGICSLPFEFTN